VQGKRALQEFITICRMPVLRAIVEHEIDERIQSLVLAADASHAFKWVGH
jgi:hypothetical protein